VIFWSLFRRWLARPQRLSRLELVRFLFPLAALGFLSGRLLHADELLGETGFHVPDLGHDDWRQPLYLPPLPDTAAWLLAALTVLAGICLSLGYRTRLAALAFALLVAWIALSDRLAAFTVTKLTPTLAFALFFSSAGTRYSVDALLARRREPDADAPELVRSGALCFIQLFLPIFYGCSAVFKARGDWLREPYVLWTHVHDSYQTYFAWLLALVTPLAVWHLLQLTIVALEGLAPLWLGWRRTRPFALCGFVVMHVMIGLMFGPVKWFSLLMIALLLGGYLPDSQLVRGERTLGRLSSFARR
jgi:uncharacterized membrane protein YphA (DoxX/SURF4 family)